LVEKTKRHGLTYLIKNTEQKTEKEKHQSKQKKTRVNSWPLKWQAFPVPLVTPVVL